MNHEKADLYTAKHTSGTDCLSAAAAWSDVRSDSSPTSFLSLTVDAAKTTHVAASGSGGLAELCATFTEAEIYFGGVRASIGGSVKFFHFFVVGSEVGAMKKGKASLLKNAVLGALEGAHGSIEISGEIASCAEREAEMKRQISALVGNDAWTIGA